MVALLGAVAQAAPPGPGEIPLPWPVQKPPAKAGDFVLVPSRQFLDAAITAGRPDGFIYYAAYLVEPGEKESKVKGLAGSEFTMPNSLIIPVKKGQTAKKGDIVLSHWTSGSGMQRGIVVGGTATEPEVLYLDIGYDNPSGWGKKTDKLKPDTFHGLTGTWQLGTTAACKDGSDMKTGRLVGLTATDVLLLSDAGSLSMAKKDTCQSLPIVPKVKKGDKVKVVQYGHLADGTVDKVDPAIGRVFVTTQFAGKATPLAAAYGDVLPGK
jgi:hypothetical protein